MALTTQAERQKFAQLPKPSGTTHNPSIFAWQKGYSAAIEGKLLTDNPYYEFRLNRMHPAYSHYRWWIKGYDEGLKAKILK